MRKKYYLIIDVETALPFGRQIPYDVGGIIQDRQGNVLETFSFVNEQVFCNGKLMQSAYYADKSPLYLHDLYRREAQPKNTGQIFTYIADLIAKYNITEIWAYNVGFDIKALRNLVSYFGTDLTISQIVDAYSILKLPICDIWRAACDILYNFQYCKWATANGKLTEKGNIQTTAEAGYGYLINDPDFEESHTGLKDCLIEGKILLAVINKKKKFSSEPLPFLYRVVKKKAIHGNKKRATA